MVSSSMGFVNSVLFPKTFISFRVNPSENWENKSSRLIKRRFRLCRLNLSVISGEVAGTLDLVNARVLLKRGETLFLRALYRALCPYRVI